MPSPTRRLILSTLALLPFFTLPAGAQEKPGTVRIGGQQPPQLRSAGRGA
ncbi:MAG: hypothetical protein JWR40_2206 [Massilia sp.]|nr:hypothetical protein [Massilia sp.]MDB5949609.1 hypothetical protein [Massilia sp.]